MVFTDTGSEAAGRTLPQAHAADIGTGLAGGEQSQEEEDSSKELHGDWWGGGEGFVVRRV